MGLKTAANMALISVGATLASATSVLAQDAGGWRGNWWWSWFRGGRGGSTGESSNAVPEIDAGAGLLAMAAVLATLALVWELRRRRSKAN
ncbi:MAG: VPEID-CTERM sorting domain-containing protein [Shimia sp.]|uniref:VPEID-CTERM sorting domain-containing protein n=1 Tax=Shimia sp. TaxID=1954381 RepID=UPI004058A7E7